MRMKGLVSEYVAVGLAGQLFGLSISRVQDVFVPERVTRIPLAPAEIAGLVNVRGRILTVIDMWRRLGLEPPSPQHRPLAVGVEHKNESYALMVESIGDVLRLTPEMREENPPNLDARMAQVSAGVYRLVADCCLCSTLIARSISPWPERRDGVEEVVFEQKW
jgi:purine-binding chemotaxis protein CheW